jgi:hypothetical protein
MREAFPRHYPRWQAGGRREKSTTFRSTRTNSTRELTDVGLVLQQLRRDPLISAVPRPTRRS